jgi:hypothetical protein
MDVQLRGERALVVRRTLLTSHDPTSNDLAASPAKVLFLPHAHNDLAGKCGIWASRDP